MVYIRYFLALALDKQARFGGELSKVCVFLHQQKTSQSLSHTSSHTDWLEKQSDQPSFQPSAWLEKQSDQPSFQPSASSKRDCAWISRMSPSVKNGEKMADSHHLWSPSDAAPEPAGTSLASTGDASAWRTPCLRS